MVVRQIGGSRGPSSQNGCGAAGNFTDGFTLGASWGPLGAESSICRFVFPLLSLSWAALGALLGCLEALLGRLGAVLGAS